MLACWGSEHFLGPPARLMDELKLGGGHRQDLQILCSGISSLGGTGPVKWVEVPVLQGGDWFPFVLQACFRDLGLTANDTLHCLPFPRTLASFIA